MDKVTKFKGEYSWLSNFAPCNIIYKDNSYPSVEHAYMSAKSDNPEWKLRCSDPNITAGQIKRESREMPLIDNWHDVKLDVMEYCVDLKFSQEPYLTLLLSTGDMVLEEGNWHNDDFWGICLKRNQGHNHLGRLIMDKRTELKLNLIGNQDNERITDSGTTCSLP